MNKILYEKINTDDYAILTTIMISAFNEDTALHTNLKEDGPTGYNDGKLIRRLNEGKDYESYKIIYSGDIVGAYTIGIGNDKEYNLEMLFIDPTYRGNHLGAIVWKDIEEKYVDAKSWTVETPDYSTRNHYFYTNKCGFNFLKENIYNNGGKSFVFKKIMS
jgi:hypothetical protein